MGRRIIFWALLMAAGCESDRGGGGRDAASDSSVGVDGGPGGGGSCGAVTCAAGMVCCDHCTGSCVPEESGAMCPDDDPLHGCDAGPGPARWTSCAMAHGVARDGDFCEFADSCGNCCCEGRTSCVDGHIATALCDCLCMPEDAGTP